MEDRYEIRGKIGQGGIGSVHRAYDRRMRREVAIKRILTSTEDIHLESEATKQLMTEVSALASLQHPHIVTVFDVGSDEKGPYIVMELINGKTLDEIVEHAPLVWHDFKVLAMQSLEALIAAGELDMIHSDLKPPNIMLTWLPSGAFQVKIVDFGLAVLVQNQSQEEIEKMEAIYGSIFFMPPEQYERKTLDTRSDLYSLGCCFYQALAGTYPFNGRTGMEVMQAHLNHTVVPINEIRSDIPLWACNWVMWLINRHPNDRPPSAREALANFLQNDKESNPVMSHGGVATAHPRLIIPSASTSPVPTSAPATAPVPTVRQTTTVHTLPLATTATASHSFGPDGVITASAISNQPLLPEKKKSSNKALVALILVIIIDALAVGGWWYYNNKGGTKQDAAYRKIAERAEKQDLRLLDMSNTELQTVMTYIIQNPQAYITPGITALAKAKSTDGSDFDAAIVKFVTSGNLQPKVRERLFEEVIETRDNTRNIPQILEYAINASTDNEALAAFNSVRDKFTESHAKEILNVIAQTEFNEVRQAAETEMKDIIASSQQQGTLAELITQARDTSTKIKSRPALERLLGRCKTTGSGNTAPPSNSQTPKPPVTPPPATNAMSVEKLVQSYETSDDAGKSAIIASLAKKTTIDSHQALMTISQSENQSHRTEAILALVEINSRPEMLAQNTDTIQQRWLQIIWRSKNAVEKKALVEALAKIRKKWAISHIEQIGINCDEATSELVKKTLQEIKESGVPIPN